MPGRDQPLASNLFGLSPRGKDAMDTFALGLMASRSPWFGEAVGQAGLGAMGEYREAGRYAEQQEAAREKMKLSQEQVDARVQQLNQAAERADRMENLATGKEAREREKFEYEKKTRPYQITPEGVVPTPGGPADPVAAERLAKAKAAGATAGKTGLDADQPTPAWMEIAARRFIRGDAASLTGLYRGAQGGQKVQAINERAAAILTGPEYGYTPEQASDFLSRNAQAFKAGQVGLSAEARTAGTREGNLNLILSATAAAIPAALDASDNLWRTGWVPLNNILEKGRIIASVPEQKEFGMANLQLAEHWARAMNPTGVMRESDRDKALSFLSTSDSPETYRRLVQQLQKQITRERDAVRANRGIPLAPNGKDTDPSKVPAAGAEEAVRPAAAPAAAAPPAAPVVPPSMGGARITPPAAPAKRVIQNGHIYELQPDGNYKPAAAAAAGP
jgi:hypothetical protein